MSVIRKACPNSYCGSTVYTKDIELTDSGDWKHCFVCNNCGHKDYYTPRTKSRVIWYAIDDRYKFLLPTYFNGKDFSSKQITKTYTSKKRLVNALQHWSHVDYTIDSINLDDI